MADMFNAVACWAASARKGGEEIASESPGHLGGSQDEMSKSKVLVFETNRLGIYYPARYSG